MQQREASKKFIENAKKIHGNRYDYSQVDYVTNTTSVKLICPDHGEFWVYPASHTSEAKKTKCPECKAEERSDSIEFVEAHLKDKKMKLLDTMHPNRKYVLTLQKIKLGCEVCNHSWITKWRNIKVNNNACAGCSKYKHSHSFQEFQELANSLNCQIIKFPENPLPFVNVRDRVDYKCNFCSSIYHDVHANNLIENQRKDQCACVKCASYKNSVSFSEAKEMIEGHGFKVVKFPDNGPFKKIKDHHNITIECPNGHIKEQRWYNLPSNGLRRRGKLPCRECAKLQMSEIQRMKLPEFLALAKEKWADRYDYSLINESNWQDSRTPVPITCHVHGMFEAVSYDFLNRKHGCPECARIEVGKKHARTNEEYVKLLKETHPKIIPLQEYDRSQVHIKHKCLECDHEWKVQPTPLLQQKYGCPVCATKIRGLAARRTHEEYVKLLAEANPNVIALEEYQRADVHIMHKCLTCNNEWKTIPNCLIGLGTGCPKCNRVGFREQWAREALEEVFGLPFPTCKPKWLKYKSQMEIDCYNEDLRLAIEYQGAQHYEPIRYFGGEENLLIRLQRDRVKCNLINEKKIVFWRFDNRKYRKLSEKEFKLAIKEEIRKNSLSKHHTPVWKPTSKKIRNFFL